METTQTIEEIIETARRDNLSNKAIRSLLFHAGYDHKLEFPAIRDALGRQKGPSGPSDEQIAARKGAAAEAEAARQAKIDEARREQKLRDEAAADQAAAKQAEIEAFQADEKARLADVAPHWPTYRKALALAAEWNDFCNAKRFGDAGDYFLRHAGEELQSLGEMVLLDERSAAADIMVRTVQRGYELTAGQQKLLALILGKLAAANGMTGEKPLSAETADRQETLAAEVDEIVVELPTAREQFVSVDFVASKKSGKPYLAKLGPTFRDREFAKGTKASGTSKLFALDGLRIGDVIEFRGFTWSRKSAAFEGGVEHAVIGEGAVYFVSRPTARSLVESGGPLVIDRETEVLRLHADAPVPEELPQRAGGDFRAFLTAADGRILEVAPWAGDEGDEDDE